MGKIVLVGMMGSGKSTLGRLLAERMGCPFADVDDVIERDAGKRIADIFRTEGEDGFRLREYEAMLRLVERPGDLALAAGGGAFCQERIRALLAGRARSVFLRVGEEELLARLARADVAERPLLRGDEWRERVAELVRIRYPIYSGADVTLDVRDGEDAAATVARLHEALAGGVDAHD
ncbi:MAG: AAA family ATPase [Planctomycetota bacterium]|jgi:shikimate kinase|nr:AAA family ATPase [Planctomycetota bacterium]